MPTLVFVSDHAGFETKSALIDFFKNKFEIIDGGTNSTNAVDYPDYVQKGAAHLKENPSAFGIFICGTGIGMSIAANRYSFIRAALCRTPKDAEIARQHNNANVLCLGGRTTDIQTAKNITETFLQTPFSNELRHLNRLQKLNKC